LHCHSPVYPANPVIAICHPGEGEIINENLFSVYDEPEERSDIYLRIFSILTLPANYSNITRTGCQNSGVRLTKFFSETSKLAALKQVEVFR